MEFILNGIAVDVEALIVLQKRTAFDAAEKAPSGSQQAKTKAPCLPFWRIDVQITCQHVTPQVAGK
jgi:hypothetical protein